MKPFLPAIATAIMIAAAPIQAPAADLVDTAITFGSFKTFVAALKTAGIAEPLRTSGPYTVFAPTDEAFAKLPPGTWNALLKDKAKLTLVLAYHVIPGKIMVADVKPGKIKTAQGDSLTIKSDNGKITIDDANVTQSDVTADNGVIHAIDAVVLPKL